MSKSNNIVVIGPKKLPHVQHESMTLQLEYGVHARKSDVDNLMRTTPTIGRERRHALRVHARRKSSGPSIEHTNKF